MRLLLKDLTLLAPLVGVKIKLLVAVDVPDEENDGLLLFKLAVPFMTFCSLIRLNLLPLKFS